MKKFVMASITVLVAITMVACASPAKSSAPDADPKASYAFGLSVGQGLAETGVAINFEELLKGVRAGMEGDFETMTIADATQLIQDAIMAADRVKNADLVKAEEDFLAANKAREGVMTTESGLQYLVTTEGSGSVPGPSDTVLIHYEGRLTDGTVFDSSRSRGEEPSPIPLDGVIPGWAEAVQLMKVGGAHTVWIPSELAYGPEGAGGVIPPYATLVFDLELLDIEGSN